MGKASKWFRGIFGLKKSDPIPNRIHPPPPPPCPNEKKKKKWSFSMSTSSSQKHEQGSNIVNIENSSVTTTADGNRSRVEWAAVMIQSHFRAYLARRALLALKALVKLQALVRGHLLRKRTADTLRQLQALVRAQTRARLTRARLSTHSHSGPQMQRNSSRSNNFEREKSHLGGRVWIDNKTTQRLWEQGSFTRRTTPTDDEKSVKVLQVDTENSNKPRFMTPKRRSLFHSSYDRNCQSLSTSKDSAEIQPFSPLKYAQNSNISSPRYYSASSKREEAFTPTKSDGSKSYLSGCSENPSYMAFTESSKAKARSLSVPKQRQQYEKSSSMKRYSVHESKREAFTNKAYPGSGRLDRLGVPIRGDWHRY